MTLCTVDPVTDEHVSCPLVTTIEDMNSSQLYTDGLCSKCYPVTTYCRGHMGRIPLTRLHVSRVYLKRVKKLLSMMCGRCDLPLVSLRPNVTPKHEALHIRLVNIYHGTTCKCTGTATDSRSMSDRLLAIYKYVESMSTPTSLHMFQIDIKDRVLIRYLLVPPRRLLAQVPDGRDIIRAYCSLLSCLSRSKHREEEEKVQAVYASYESAMKEKTGILRQILVPRRLGNSGRAVIVGNPHIGLCDIVVPDIMAYKLCSDILVTDTNISECVYNIQQQRVATISYGRHRFKLASCAVHISVTGLEGMLSPGSHILGADDVPLCTYTRGNVLEVAHILRGYDATVVQCDQISYTLPSYKTVLLYVDVVKDNLVIKVPLEIGASVAMPKDGHRVLVYRNPVLSADSMHTHNMLVAHNHKSLTMSTSERQHQRNEVHMQQWQLSLGDTARWTHASQASYVPHAQGMNVPHTSRAQDVNVHRSIHGTRVPGTDTYRVTSVASSHRVYTTPIISNYALGLHPLAVGSYQGDFDGDEINVCELPQSIDMSLVLLHNRRSYGLTHDAMYGCYCLVHGMIEPPLAQDMDTQGYIQHLVQDPNRVTVPSRFNVHLCSYAERHKVENVSDFYSQVAMYMCLVCDEMRIDADVAVASKCRPSEATLTAIRDHVGLVTYTTPGDVIVVDMVQSSYGKGVSQEEFLTLCYANRMQAVEKAVAVAPEGDNMRLEYNYMSSLTESGGAWSTRGRVFHREIHSDTLQSLKERRAIELPRTYSGIVSDTAPLLPYRPLAELPDDLRRDRLRVLHVGQRKLLMCELDFLTDYALDGDIVVVYAGAAPGTHMVALTELFPNVIFHLYDTRPFSPVLYNKVTHKSREHLIIFSEYMTVSTATTYKDKKVLFISDIRTSTTDEGIAADNALNVEIVQHMNPVAAMLKYRLPYADGYTTMFEGELRHQCWGTRQSTEVRLICVRPYKTTQHHHRTHEQRMYHHNLVRPYPILGAPLLRHICTIMTKVGGEPYYDWYRESAVVSKYMTLTYKSESYVYRLTQGNMELDLSFYVQRGKMD